MKNILLLALFLIGFEMQAQVEGQKFCDGNPGGSYLPLDINKKKILWSDTYYFETLEGKKDFEGRTYTEFKQEWKNGDISLIYLRQENGITYEYRKKCNKEYLKLDSNAGDKKWETDCRINSFRIVAADGELETPYCQYKNLLVVEVAYEKVTYRFYYQKGYGYVGATLEGKLISCVSPEWDKD